MIPLYLRSKAAVAPPLHPDIQCASLFLNPTVSGRKIIYLASNSGT